ncbi:MAG: hypothetical protein J6M92_14725 [Oribacterium sp.]|nr:hypothetical protein [Oribacterium sp.]
MKENFSKEEAKPRGVTCESIREDAEIISGELPVVETYNEGLVPTELDNEAQKTEKAGEYDKDREKYIEVGDYITMTKLLFDKHRLQMYSFLNRELRSSRLEYFAGFKARNKSINRDVCSFGDVTFWRVDREDFIADVNVELSLENEERAFRRLKGYLTLWFNVKSKWDCSVEGLEREKPDREGLTMLSPFLIPYYKSHDMDVEAEKIWEKYLPEALEDRAKLKAVSLAESMKLSIVYHELYEDSNIDSILFFKEGPLKILEEDPGLSAKKRYTVKSLNEIRIPAGTIVVNSARIRRDYSYFNIYHECFHNEIHYLFFRLQEMGSNDTRQIKTKKVPVDKEHPVNDPLYWAEKQANRGAYGLMMPLTDTARLISSELGKVDTYTHRGSLYSQAGKAVAKEVHLPHFRVRARMIQLGHVHARGALNYVRKVEIAPFDFDDESWRGDSITFVIDEITALSLACRDEEFKELLHSKKYIYADGHIVRNDPRFIVKKKGGYYLTEWAEKNVDSCCLRFYRSYEQKSVGVYVYGRMNYDADYIKQTAFYLEDLINKEQIDDLDAKEKYIQTFPKGFREAVDQLRKKKKVSYERLSEYMEMDKATLLRWMEDPRYYRNKDFLTIICLALELPDWISRLVFKRAGVMLDEDDKRDMALQHILRAQSGEGKEVADDYLKKRNLAALAI